MTDWLATAIYGPDRLGYWQQALRAAGQPDAAAPARARIAELQHTRTQDETRIQRQVIALEAAETTPAAQQRINQRIQELDERLQATQAALRKLQAQQPPPPPLRDHLRGMPPHHPLAGHRGGQALADQPP